MGESDKTTVQMDPAANAPDAAAFDKGKGKGKGRAVEAPEYQDSSMDEDEESDEAEDVVS